MPAAAKAPTSLRRLFDEIGTVDQLHDDVEVEKLLQALLRREGIQKTNDLKREEKANQIFCLQPGTDKKLKLEIKAKGGLGLKPQKHGITEVF